jgi:hypothetical protein
MHLTNRVHNQHHSALRWGVRRRRECVRLNPADYGFKVTIAIAARTADQQHIITVSDRRLSFGADAPAADNALLKDYVICEGWGTLFAADDASFALPIIRHAAYLIKDGKKAATERNVRRAMCDAYAAVLDEYIYRDVLRKFGFDSVAHFKSEQSRLSRNFGRTIARRIDRIHLSNTEFLVYGFDSEYKGTHLFHVEHPGSARSLDHIGYYAIGSGCKMAMNSLQMRPFIGLTDAGLIYRLVEAKFSAETADGVGPDTTVFIVGRGESSAGFLSQVTIEKFRAAWEKWRREPPSEEILKLIHKSSIPLS